MGFNGQQGHKEVVAVLIDRGAVVDFGDRWGETPLHAAVSVSIDLFFDIICC